MSTNVTNVITAASTLGVMDEELRRKFWAEYTQWTHNASDEELAIMQKALESLTTHEVVGISRLIRQALTDEQRRRQLPASLVAQLEAANWPGAQANG